jgi:hypothetical protein
MRGIRRAKGKKKRRIGRGKRIPTRKGIQDFGVAAGGPRVVADDVEGIDERLKNIGVEGDEMGGIIAADAVPTTGGLLDAEREGIGDGRSEALVKHVREKVG